MQIPPKRSLDGQPLDEKVKYEIDKGEGRRMPIHRVLAVDKEKRNCRTVIATAIRIRVV